MQNKASRSKAALFTDQLAKLGRSVTIACRGDVVRNLEHRHVEAAHEILRGGDR